MPFTATSDDQRNAYGYLYYPSTSFSQNSAVTLPVLEGMNALTSTLRPTGVSIPVWIYQWYLNLNASTLTSNPSKFISALGKFDLGAVDFIWRGQCSYSSFWNYQSQRFPVMYAWSVDADIAYPSPYVAPAPITNAYIIPFSGATVRPATNYATEFSVILQSALVAGVSAYIFFEAGAFNYSTPASFGEI